MALMTTMEAMLKALNPFSASYYPCELENVTFTLGGSDSLSENQDNTIVEPSTYLRLNK